MHLSMSSASAVNLPFISRALMFPPRAISAIVSCVQVSRSSSSLCEPDTLIFSCELLSPSVQSIISELCSSVQLVCSELARSVVFGCCDVVATYIMLPAMVACASPNVSLCAVARWGWPHLHSSFIPYSSDSYPTSSSLR